MTMQDPADSNDSNAIAIVGMAAETNRLVTALGVPVDDVFLVDAPAGRTPES